MSGPSSRFFGFTGPVGGSSIKMEEVITKLGGFLGLDAGVGAEEKVGRKVHDKTDGTVGAGMTIQDYLWLLGTIISRYSEFRRLPMTLMSVAHVPIVAAVLIPLVLEITIPIWKDTLLGMIRLGSMIVYLMVLVELPQQWCREFRQLYTLKTATTEIAVVFETWETFALGSCFAVPLIGSCALCLVSHWFSIEKSIWAIPDSGIFLYILVSWIQAAEYVRTSISLRAKSVRNRVESKIMSENLDVVEQLHSRINDIQQELILIRKLGLERDKRIQVNSARLLELECITKSKIRSKRQDEKQSRGHIKTSHLYDLIWVMVHRFKQSCKRALRKY
ncbi:uncharacterized protein V1516DRAFT_672348 [Lipomyces oligophaga]|uniref:uncharacterized protein n=1 Tax=Lipomyces oligophaga TaxID=45792 RepID=UPI0034CFA46A